MNTPSRESRCYCLQLTERRGELRDNNKKGFRSSLSKGRKTKCKKIEMKETKEREERREGRGKREERENKKDRQKQ